MRDPSHLSRNRKTAHQGAQRGAAFSIDPISPIATTPTPKVLDNPRGLVVMALAMFAFAAVDAQAKFLTESLHPIQVAWTRQFGLLLGLVLLLALRGAAVLRSSRVGLQIARGVLAAISATLFIVAVSFAPLADAVAVSFVAPFVVTILGALLLKEPVGPRRWTAVVIGFLGALIVIRPGFGTVHPALGLVILAAILFALRQVLSRALAATDSTQTTVAYTALAGGVLLSLPLPFLWRWPEASLELALMASVALTAAVAEVLVIKALEIAQAVVVAPVQYTLMIWGVMYGALIFGQFPDLWTWTGTAIIITSGLYTFHRERTG